ncbi:TIR domain-containing adapter molecule 1 [Aulostomus maculatus]
MEVQEALGTGLRDVYDILVKAPPEQVQSLTYQLGESPEDNIIHAFCLIILQKEDKALNKLQMLGDNYLASHLAKIWEMSGGKLGDFRVRCGDSCDFTIESLAGLARIFKVLSEHRLCDPPLRNLAYKRALSVDGKTTGTCEGLVYNQLREEAKDVCGHQFAEWLFSSKDLKSGSYSDSGSSQGDTMLKVALSQDPSVRSQPSPLQVIYSESSYPTHLEMSIPPTATYAGDKITSENPQQSPEGDVKEALEQLLQIKAKTDTKMDAAEGRMDHSIKKEPPQQTTKPICNTATPRVTVSTGMHSAEEEDEATFYSFVILHAPEDAEVAESIKERVEAVIDSEGATYAEDFAIPGRSTLRCVEDAINNSAYTLLLLTQNFNSRLLEMKTDSALINSINHHHKYNTVIPLLPKENRMPELPLVLRAIIPLDENKNFERKTKKALSPAKIKQIRKIWTEEQRKLKWFHLKQKRQMHNKTAQLRETLLFPGTMDFNSVQAVWQPQPNIHIENAKYIMIGNDSQMTVDYGGGTEEDDSIGREDEQ